MKTVAAAPAHRCVSIVAWNDLHGQISPDWQMLDSSRVPVGGLVAIADNLARIRESGEPVVVLDSGDLFMGPLESTLAEGAPIVAAYNVMGVDAVAIGNHEFDFGPIGYTRPIAAPDAPEMSPDGRRGALLARMSEAYFPFMAANIHYTGGGALQWPNYLPSTIIHRGGFDIGVVGYTTIETPTSTLAPNVAGLDFATNAAQSVAAQIHALRKSGANPVVLLAHASLTGELPEALDSVADPDPQGKRRAGEIATLLDAMPAEDYPDIIIAGHRHQWMLGRVRGVPIVSSDAHGMGLARIRYCEQGETPANVNTVNDAGAQRLTLQSIERIVAMPTTAPLTKLGIEVAASVLPWQAKVEAQADAVVTTLPRLCPVTALNGTGLAEQLATAIKATSEEAAAALPKAPLVAFINNDGLRTPLRPGPLRYRDIFATFPFESGVAVCATTRGGLEKMIANAIRAPEARDHLTFAIAGATVNLKRDSNAKLSLVHLAVDGDPERKGTHNEDPLLLAIPDFILWGGDGMLDGVKCTPSVTSTVRVREALQAILVKEQSCDKTPKNIKIEGPSH